ncbi:MAG: glycosyltransferase family 2 protein [Bryobacteraceae bacterium]
MLPTVSVIIPMRNEERRIGQCLKSIVDGTYPLANCEILAVDGASKDHSREILLRKIMHIPYAHLLSNPKQQVSSGLNIAIRQAHGEFVFRMDAHCEYSKDYFKMCLQELKRTRAANVGGGLETMPGGSSWVSRCIASVSKHPVGVGNAAFRLGKGGQYVDTVPFGAYRREIFETVGVYHEDLPRNQDYELNARIRAAGFPIYLSACIQTTYYNSTHIIAFMRQAGQNGWFAVRCWLLNPHSFCWRHAAPVLFVISMTFLIGLSAQNGQAQLATIIFGLLYMIALLRAGIQIALYNDWRHALLAPILIASYHLTYGIATLISSFFAIVIFLSRRLNDDNNCNLRDCQMLTCVSTQQEMQNTICLSC